MSAKTVTLIFFAKLLLLLILAYNAKSLISYEGNFPYQSLINSFSLPFALTSLASFDGAHYISIAQNSYHQYEQAFFPLYPSLIRILGPLLLNNYLLVGIIISNFSSLIGLLLLNKWLIATFDKKTASFTMLFYFAFPTSFFFHTVYTEGLFLLLTAGFLFFASQKKYAISGIFGFFSSLTRLVGVLNIMLLPLFFKKKWITIRGVMLSLIIATGLFSYMFYLWQSSGDAMAFFTSQSQFGLNRSTHVIILPQVYFRYLKILLFSSHTYQYFVALFEVSLFTFMIGLAVIYLYKGFKKKHQEMIMISIFSLSHLLIPTLTGTLLSTPRFALFSFASFLCLSTLRQNRVKYVVVTIFIMLQLWAALFFVSGYFIS